MNYGCRNKLKFVVKRNLVQKGYDYVTNIYL